MRYMNSSWNHRPALGLLAAFLLVTGARASDQWVDYKGHNVLASNDLRQGIKDFSNWPTVPQLYVKGEFVGGCDIVREMFQTGELKPFLEEQGVLTEA